MKIIKVQKLNDETFKKYGVYQDLFNDAQMLKRTVGIPSFHADVLSLDFGICGNLPTVSVCHATKIERNIVKFLEYHHFTCEGLLPLDSDIIIFVGVPGLDEISVNNLEAFLVPKGTFVKLNPCIIHGAQYVVGHEEAHVVCMLPGRTFKNDMSSRSLTEEVDMAELLM